jgi:hypothetical protein
MIGVEASEFDTRWGGVPVVRPMGCWTTRRQAVGRSSIRRRRRSGLCSSLNRSNPDAETSIQPEMIRNLIPRRI